MDIEQISLLVIIADIAFIIIVLVYLYGYLEETRMHLRTIANSMAKMSSVKNEYKEYKDKKEREKEEDKTTNEPYDFMK